MSARLRPGLLTTLGNDNLPPRLLSDKEVEEMRERELRSLIEKRSKLAGIPVRYKGASLDECDKRVRDYAEAIRGKATGPWLLLSGPNGTGKTYAACAVINSELADMTAKFTTMSEIIRTDWNTKSLSEYTNPKRLVIDDFGKEKPTIYSLERFFDVLNKRDSSMKPTIITTNYGKQGMLDYLTVDGNDEYAKAIVSRLMSKENVRVPLSGRDRRL